MQANKIEYHGGFNRLFHDVPHVTPHQPIELGLADVYFSGQDDGHIYLTGKNDITLSLMLDVITGRLDTLEIEIPDNDLFAPKIHVNNESLNIMDGYAGIIYRKGKDQRYYNIAVINYPFIGALPVSTNSVVTLSVFNKQTQMVLINTGAETKKRFSNILDPQMDGIFCTLGDLHRDQKNSRLVYVYRYRNSFILLDSNLNVLRKTSTIDTNRMAKIKVFDTETSKHMVSTNFPVNKLSTCADGYLYVLSNAHSDNELKGYEKSHRIIDSYNLQNGKYLHSFYIPQYKGLVVNDLIVANKVLYALYGSTLVSFHLPEF